MTFQARSFRVVRTLALAAALTAMPWESPASAQTSVVHAVLFYSPTCPHCHEVINTHLPPLRERYGDRFFIVGVDVTTADGAALYEAAVEYYGLAPDRLGVPLLVIGDVTLLGSLEIPEQLPGLIESGLAAGGTDWPGLPALRQALTAQGLIPQQPAEVEAPPVAPESRPQAGPRHAAADTGRAAVSDTTSGPGESGAPADTPAEDATAETPARGRPAGGSASGQGAELTTSFDTAGASAVSARQRFLQDPAANAIAVLALFVLAGALTLALLGVRDGGPRVPVAPPWAIPALAFIGLAIAAYLSQVEVTGAHAVCGPVGDCNTVQQSEYARMFGVPVGILGALGYLAILAAWGLSVTGPQAKREGALRLVWVFALVGCVFSLYLTFLEPFVIGATCAWCVSSALIMAALLVLATGAVRRTS